jgi:hypothetical protein
MEFFALLIILLYILAIFGYLLNIIKIFQSIREPISTLIILRIVGIFVTPLGAVLGFV